MIKTFRCSRCGLNIAPVGVNYHSCPACGERTYIQTVSVPEPSIYRVPDAAMTQQPKDGT